MKRIITVITLACAVAAASSCTFIRINKDFMNASGTEHIIGSKDIVSRSFNVEQFTGIDTTVGADIDFKMSEGEPSVTVEAPDNIIDKLDIQVENGVLMVRLADDRYSIRNGNIRIKASAATLESLDIKGAGDFDCLDLDCAAMDVNISGAGDVTFNDLRCESDVNVTVHGAGDIDLDGLSCRKVSVEIMGAGDVRLTGKAESASLSIKGAGDIDARELDCDDISSSVSGMGSIRRK